MHLLFSERLCSQLIVVRHSIESEAKTMERFWDGNPLLPPRPLAYYFDELAELLNDLFFNGGQHHIEPFLVELDRVDLDFHVPPSFTLVEIIAAIDGCEPRGPEFQELVAWAIQEMIDLTHPT